MALAATYVGQQSSPSPTPTDMAPVATDVGSVDDLDFNIDDLDVIQAFDIDLLVDDDREFRTDGGYYAAIFADADIVSHCRQGCEDGDGDSGAAEVCGWLLAGLGDGAEEEEEEAGSSPADSIVTDGRSLSSSAGDTDATEAMSAYVAELERFLLEDDDEQAEVDQGLLGVVDDYYFSGDQLLTNAEVVPVADAAAARSDEEEYEKNSDGGNDGVLAAREDEQQSASRKRARYE